MLNKHFNRETAFTRFELALIVATVAMLLALISIALSRAKGKARREQCFRNLMEIGLAFLMRPPRSSDLFPMRVSEDQGGVQQSVVRGEVFHAFQALSNELSSPKLFVCPSDTRTPALEFATLLSNTNVSYFVSLDAVEDHPASFLTADRNLELDDMPTKSGIAIL